MTPNLEFDTGFDVRAFAQAKFARCLIEPGLIVRPGETSNRVELWKASGVQEKTGAGGKKTMVVWGPPVDGERLDTLINDSEQKDKVLAAISLWIQAVLALEENTPPGGGSPMEVPLWPSAAIITQADNNNPPSVFFAPPTLSQRSVSHNDKRYVNPALSGIASNGGAAAAFTAAAMLYQLFTGSPPFSADETSALHENMRDAHFLPVRFAVPGMEPRLASLMQAALERAADGGGLNEFLAILIKDGQTVSAASLVHPLAETDRLRLEKEKARLLIMKTASIKTRRFVASNTALLLGVLAAAVVAFLIVYGIIDARAHKPTTAGMEPVQVIETYYRSMGVLDHQMMEACVTGDAGKNDISAVINLFVISKTRQAYEQNTRAIIFPAQEWEGGDPPPVPLFGAADVRVESLDNKLGASELRYRADYMYWIPAQTADDLAVEPAAKMEADGDVLSLGYLRSDFLTVILKKDKWRIAEITR